MTLLACGFLSVAVMGCCCCCCWLPLSSDAIVVGCHCPRLQLSLVALVVSRLSRQLPLSSVANLVACHSYCLQLSPVDIIGAVVGCCWLPVLLLSMPLSVACWYHCLLLAWC